MFETPIAVLFDSLGKEIAVSGNQSVTANQPGVAVFGSASNGFNFFKLDDFGALFITGTIATIGGNVATQGNAGSIGQSWFIKITDGTQVLGTGSSAPIFITGSVGISSIASPINVANFPTTQSVKIDQTITLPVSISNTPTITGSVGITSITSPINITSSFAFPVWVTGSVLTGGGIASTVSQGNAGSIGQSWFIEITDGTKVLGTGSSAPLFVTGAVGISSIASTVNITGSTTINSIASTVTTTGSNFVFNNTSQPLFVTGTISLPRAPNTVVTGFGASTTSVTLLGANSSRSRALLYMDGAATAYIKFGAVASTSSFSLKVNSNGYYETPDSYTGRIDAVFSVDNSALVLRVTEMNE